MISKVVEDAIKCYLKEQLELEALYSLWNGFISIEIYDQVFGSTPPRRLCNPERDQSVVPLHRKKLNIMRRDSPEMVRQF